MPAVRTYCYAPIVPAARATSFADVLRSSSTRASSLPPAIAAAAVAEPPPPAPKPRFPPLVVKVFPNWAQHFLALQYLLGHASNARPFGKGVRFSPSSEYEYRAVQRYLSDLEKTENVYWYTYGLPSEMSKKVAIRGLPVYTTPEDVTEALAELGFRAEYVRPIKARMGRPGCLFFALLTNTPNLIPAIYQVTELLYMPGIKIEAWRSKKGQRDENS